jgi:hypothetical protein
LKAKYRDLGEVLRALGIDQSVLEEGEGMRTRDEDRRSRDARRGRGRDQELEEPEGEEGETLEAFRRRLTADRHRRRQIVIATDLFPDPDRPDIARHDFLRGAPPPEARGAVMLTNPPNSELTEFLVRGLALMDAGYLAGMALLTRLGADTTKAEGQRSPRRLRLEDVLAALLETAPEGRPSATLDGAMELVAARRLGAAGNGMPDTRRDHRAAPLLTIGT